MDSPRLRILSGSEMVSRGRNVTDTQLPDVGTKEVAASGSWLEQKQVQAALETRKTLLAVERIDKVGCLSHAEWLEEKKLAEVTQQVGGYWQYLGHKVNGTYYLLPEEALYLIETNCLLLKHNNVTVSLQKAYSLLLDEEMPLIQYKVYASLSRIGYKVFRHDRLKISAIKSNGSAHFDLQQDNNAMEVSMDETNSGLNIASKVSQKKPGIKSLMTMATDVVMDKHGQKPEVDRLHLEQPISNVVITNNNDPTGLPFGNGTDKVNALETDEPHDSTKISDEIMTDLNTSSEAIEHPSIQSLMAADSSIPTEDKIITEKKAIFSVDENGVVRLGVEDTNIAMEMDPGSTTEDQTTNNNKMEIDADIKEDNKIVRLNIYIAKKLKIQNRNVQSSDPMSINDKFKDIPDFYKQQIVTVKVPSEDYLPRNVFLNNTSYVVNVTNLSNKPLAPCQTPIRPTGNRAMYKTIRNSIESENAAVPAPEPPQFVPNTPLYERPYGYYPNWRLHLQRPIYQQPRFNQHPYFYRMMNSMPQNVTYIPRPPFNLNHIQRQKIKHDHLEALKSLAQTLNHVSPSNYMNLKFSVNGLINRFNKIYGEKIIITPENRIIDSKQRIETIEIQDDEVDVGDKQQKVNKYDQYLDNIKMLAARMKNLARKKQPIAKQKRAFSKLVKHFNKAYDAELYLDDNGELADRKLVVLDSSDSDVAAVDEIVPTNKKKRKSLDKNGTNNKKRKILANPFSVIAKLNKSISKNASEIPQVTTQGIEKYFDKNWLPGDDDFGKALPCSKTDARHLLNDSQLLYEFMEDPTSFKTWTDLKLTFYTHMEAVFSFEQDLTESRNLSKHSRVKPILQGAVTEDWTSSEKLKIIKTNMDTEETSLCAHFDVYKRDVQNFKKTDPPAPHFRIVCINESSRFPSTAEVRSLEQKYDDNVNITFAVVGVASISYLQIKPTDLPPVSGND